MRSKGAKLPLMILIRSGDVEANTMTIVINTVLYL